MAKLKTAEEIELLRNSNILVSKTLAEIAKVIEPGISTLKLDQLAEEFIRDHHAIPAFKGYHDFPATLCTSVNEQVVHGIPSNYILKEGDIVSVDCGVFLNNYVGDSAFTFAIGNISKETENLLKATRESLFKGIEKAVHGMRMGDLANAVQNHVEQLGYSVVREMVGHGIGTKLHEAPEVPNYGRKGNGIKLEAGMVLCIEPMINMGKKEIVQENDGWTIRTVDRKPSAHFELAVAVGLKEAQVLSTFDYIEEVLKNK